MRNGKIPPWKLAAVAGVVAVVVGGGAMAWMAARSAEDAPPPLPGPRLEGGAVAAAAPIVERTETLRASKPGINIYEAELARLRATSELERQEFRDQFTPPGSDGRAMYWAGKRADDPAADPKVIAYLKARGITDPERAYDLFPYQWQVDWLYGDDEPKR